MNITSNTKNVYAHTEKGIPVWCYRSGMTVYEEALIDGHLVSYGMNGAGYPQNVVEGTPTRPTSLMSYANDVFDFEVNGVTANHHLTEVSFVTSDETRENGTVYTHARLTLKPSHVDVNITVHTELDGTSVIVRYLTVENTGTGKLNISSIAPVSGRLDEIASWQRYMEAPAAEKVFSLGYMDYAHWGHEGLFKWHDLDDGGTSVAGKYEAGRHRHPAFFLRNNLIGGIFSLQLAYSGGFEFDFNYQSVSANRDTDIDRATLDFAVRIKSPNPQRILDKAESFTTPAVHFSKLFGDLDDSVNAMHKHIRRSVILNNAPDGKYGLLATGFGSDRPMDMRMVRHFVNIAKDVGAEAVLIDAGWYCPPDKFGEWHKRTGDWQFNTELYPNGSREVADCIHEAGLKFGLWMDPERLGIMSEMAKEHPEWLGKSFKNGATGSIIDMSNPGAVSWVESEVARVLSDNQVDLFRLDYNIAVHEIFCEDTDGGCNTLEYYENVYAMYERLKKKFPSVYFENCAGGGARTDLGMMKNFTHTWVSDHQIAPRSFAITNGMTMVLPPEYVDRLVSGMSCHTRGSIDFQVRQTIFGKPTCNSFNPFDSEMNEGMIAFVKHTYDIYKDFIRPYIQQTVMYHHTPELFGDQPNGNGIIERACEDKTRSVIGVFRLSNMPEKEDIIVHPRGIDPSWEYRVIYDNAVLSGGSPEGTVVDGFALVNGGLRVHLADSLTSELIILERV